MNGKHIRCIIDVLRDAIKKRDWELVKHVEALLNMHTMDEIFKKEV